MPPTSSRRHPAGMTGKVVGALANRNRVYEKRDVLCERINDGLPWDEQAERAAIGAVLIAPGKEAKRLVRRAFRGHFYLDVHAWWWFELDIALWRLKVDWDSEQARNEWNHRHQSLGRHRRTFDQSALPLLAKCLNADFWWYGDYWIDRVLAAAKVRAKVIASAEQLSEALNKADEWRRA